MDLGALTPVKTEEYSSTERSILEKLMNAWMALSTSRDSFVVQELDDPTGYSLLVDSGTAIHKFELGFVGGSSKASLKVVQYV